MTTINFGKREILCKIVYYGPGVGGKTTNLAMLHQLLAAEMKGELLTLATETDRTIFFDMMPVEVGEIEGFKVRFTLYTVPGQVQYVNSRKAILAGVDGVVFVADSTPTRWLANTESMLDLRANLMEYDLTLPSLPLVLQYNKRDVPGALPVAALAAELNPFGMPSFEAIASQGIGVQETLRAICQRVMEQLNKDG